MSSAPSSARRAAGASPSQASGRSARTRVERVGRARRERRRPRRRPSPRRAAGRGRRAAGRGGADRRAGGVHDEQQRAVVDEPGAPVPDQEVRVARAAVDVRQEPVEPDDRRGLRPGPARRPPSASKGSAPGRKSTPEVEAGAGRDEVLDLGVGLGAAQLGVDVGAHELGHREAQRPRELPAQQLGHERRGPLPGPAELQDVEPVVVGLDEPGQRAALAQRGDVARGADRSQHGPQASRARGAGRPGAGRAAPAGGRGATQPPV